MSAPAPGAPLTTASRPFPLWLPPAFVVAVVLAVAYGLGEPSLPGLALLGLLALALAGAWLARSPAGAAAGLPLLLLPPQFLKVYAYEVALAALAGVLVVVGIRQRRAWLARVDAIELAVAGLLAWAVFTGFWCGDLWWYTFGVRKMAVGLLALWASWRLARVVGPGSMENGVTLGALGIAGLTLLKAVTFGLEAGGSATSRRESTDVGWGNSNFIAALLVLMVPTVLALAIQRERPLARRLAWVTLPMIAAMVAVAASRGGAILFALGIVVFLARLRPGRHQLALLAAAAVSIGVLVLGPGGTRLAERFTSTREQGSAVIRLLFYREGWHRLRDHLPWGIGLGQGYGFPDRLGIEDPHNYWLVVGPELGVVGLALWIVVIVLTWRRASALARDPVTRDIGRTLQLTIVLSQLNSLFEPTFQGLQYHFVYYWIVGGLLGGAAVLQARATSPPVVRAG